MTVCIKRMEVLIKPDLHSLFFRHLFYPSISFTLA